MTTIDLTVYNALVNDDGSNTVGTLATKVALLLNPVLTPVQTAVTALDAVDALKAPLASPTFTGVPAAPTASVGTNTTQLASTAFVQAALPVVDPRVCEGRLTLTTAVPVTTADVTAATTLRFALYGGNLIALYSGSAWALFTFPELSIAVPATTSQMYDVFVYDNAGTRTLELLAWTNDTTRATALVLQDGVLCKTGALTRRYVGSFRTTTVSGQTEDSYLKRFVWNYSNRARRPMRAIETTDTWNYTIATFRQANAAAANQLAFVMGVAEVLATVSVQGRSVNTNANINAVVSIGYDSTTTPATGVFMADAVVPASSAGLPHAELLHYPAVGYHTYVWLEYSAATGTCTWSGDGGATFIQCGIHGSIDG